VRRELERYVECGLLCRGFAVLACKDCPERRLVAFSGKGRGSCPSCLGRRMAQTAARLLDHVLPPVPLRQFVLPVPFELRARLAFDGRCSARSAASSSTPCSASTGAACAPAKASPAAAVAVTAVQRANADLDAPSPLW
jgi:hypothetical protein